MEYLGTVSPTLVLPGPPQWLSARILPKVILQTNFTSTHLKKILASAFAAIYLYHYLCISVAIYLFQHLLATGMFKSHTRLGTRGSSSTIVFHGKAQRSSVICPRPHSKHSSGLLNPRPRATLSLPQTPAGVSRAKLSQGWARPDSGTRAG